MKSFLTAFSFDLDPGMSLRKVSLVCAAIIAMCDAELQHLAQERD